MLSSRTEASPLVLVEAMASGCPSVSFGCNYGPSEIIEDGRSGILVEEGNISALTEGIERIVNDKCFGATLSKEGRKRARQYEVNGTALRWIREFKAMIVAKNQFAC